MYQQTDGDSDEALLVRDVLDQSLLAGPCELPGLQYSHGSGQKWMYSGATAISAGCWTPAQVQGLLNQAIQKVATHLVVEMGQAGSLS